MVCVCQLGVCQLGVQEERWSVKTAEGVGEVVLLGKVKG